MDAILHVVDWNLRDKYYQMSIELLKEFRRLVLEKDIDAAWDWMTSQTDYDRGRPGHADNADLPIKFGTVDMTLDEYFMDYSDPVETVSDWDFSDDPLRITPEDVKALTNKALELQQEGKEHPTPERIPFVEK